MNEVKEKRFIDNVKLILRSGNGGNGSIHKLVTRNKIIKDGGSGGRGGSIYLKANKEMQKDLSMFKKHKIFGNNGEHGRAKEKDGRNGNDLYISVPEGIEVYTVNEENDKQEYLSFLEKHNQEIRIVEGGRGGIGNYKNKKLEISDLGKEGTTKTILLQLKILCDIGLIGFPNVGKSTLLGTLTRALPKIANYPFTTLNPIIGKIKYINGKEITIGDIPGIIEGASQNKGLGFEFLTHISRCKLIVFVLDISDKNNNIINQYKILKDELEKYNNTLTLKHSLIFANKIDRLTSIEIKDQIDNFRNQYGLDIIPWSAKDGTNIESIVSKFYKLLHN